MILVDADAQGSATAWASRAGLPVRCETMPLEDGEDPGRWVARVRGLAGAYVVIDCPPHIGAATGAAIGVADLVLIPVGASGLDIAATRPTLRLLAEARRRRTDGGPRALLVPAKVDGRTAAGREITAALTRLGEPVAPVIHQRIAFADAYTAAAWIGSYAPDSEAHREIAALAATIRETLP